MDKDKAKKVDENSGQGKTEKQLFHIFLVLPLLLLVGGIIYTKLWTKGMLEVPCLFYEKLHIYCPACGMSHAFLYLLTGDLIKSLKANPLIFLALLFYIGYIVIQVFRIIKYRENTIYIGFPTRLFYIWCLMLLVYCMAKNLFFIYLKLNL